MKNDSKSERFIAGGEEITRSSESYKRKEKEVRNRIYEETLWEWSIAPWWKKPYLKWKIESRINDELDRQNPPDALYLKSK